MPSRSRRSHSYSRSPSRTPRRHNSSKEESNHRSEYLHSRRSPPDRHQNSRSQHEERHERVRDERGRSGRLRDDGYDRGDRGERYSRDGRQDQHRRRDSPDRRQRNGSRSPKRRRVEGNPFARMDERPTQPPAVGSIHRAHVRSVKPFGVFVTLQGYRRDALVHHSQVSEDLNLGRDEDDEDKITALEYFCRPGSEVWVKVTEVADDGRGGTKLGCSMRAVDQETGQDLDPDNSLALRSRGGGRGEGRGGPLSDDPPRLGSIHRATVASLRPFGAFVRLDGYRSNGLVHVFQVSDHMEMNKEDSDEAKIAALGQVLAVGEAVWVKVTEIKDADPGSDRGPKIGCSIKLVSQRDGQDLDPHGLKYKPRQGDGGPPTNRRVGGDVGQVQQGTIDWGYLNADKVNMDPKYSAYELVGAEGDGAGLPRDQPGNAGLDDLPGPPMGRGRDMVKPAWMQTEGQQAPGITSVEEALAILRKHGKKAKKSKSKKKHKEDKKAKKAKKGSKAKKKHSKRTSDSSSSDSE